MKAKKTIMGVLLVLGILVAIMTNAFAAEDWYTCTIDRLGGATSDSGAIIVRLTDTKGAFTKANFTIPEGRLNQILAVLLTAASTGSTVYVKADPVAKKLLVVYYNGY